MTVNANQTDAPATVAVNSMIGDASTVTATALNGSSRTACRLRNANSRTRDKQTAAPQDRVLNLLPEHGLCVECRKPRLVDEERRKCSAAQQEQRPCPATITPIQLLRRMTSVTRDEPRCDSCDTTRLTANGQRQQLDRRPASRKPGFHLAANFMQTFRASWPRSASPAPVAYWKHAQAPTHHRTECAHRLHR